MGVWCDVHRLAVPLSVATIGPLSLSSSPPAFAFSMHARVDDVDYDGHDDDVDYDDDVVGWLGFGGRVDDNGRQGREATPGLLQCRHFQG